VTEISPPNSEEDDKIYCGRRRLKLLRVGQSGRPKKIYQTRNMKILNSESVLDA